MHPFDGLTRSISMTLAIDTQNLKVAQSIESCSTSCKLLKKARSCQKVAEQLVDWARLMPAHLHDIKKCGWVMYLQGCRHRGCLGEGWEPQDFVGT